MKTKPRTAIINDTIAALKAREAELDAELTEVRRAIRSLDRDSGTGRPVKCRNKSAVESLFANNGNEWLTARAIRNALPQCNRGSLVTAVYMYARDGYLETRPAAPPTHPPKRGNPMLSPRLEYRLAEPPTT